MWTFDHQSSLSAELRLPGQPAAIAACRGRVWAAFEVKEADEVVVEVGPHDGEAWRLERVPSSALGTTEIGFDEACRPFVSVAGEVFAHATDGWRGGSLSALGTVYALVGHDGTLYAGIVDGNDVSIATAPIVTERDQL